MTGLYTESCLTGNVQLAIVFMKLFRELGEYKYMSAAQRLIDLVKSTQSVHAGCPDVRGGIAGSFPVWGNYLGLIYPNWAAKFFTDSIMLKLELLEKSDNNA